eukprot:368002-Pyramimonas_sp.AAC.1
MAPRGPQMAHRRSPGGTTRLPSGPQDTPKRCPRGTKRRRRRPKRPPSGFEKTSTTTSSPTI